MPPNRTAGADSAEAQMSMPKDLESLPMKGVGAFIEKLAQGRRKLPSAKWLRTRLPEHPPSVRRGSWAVLPKAVIGPGHAQTMRGTSVCRAGDASGPLLWVCLRHFLCHERGKLIWSEAGQTAA